MDLNKAMIIGRLSQAPEKKVIPTGQTVCSFSVATNRTWTNQSGEKQEQTEFHNIVTWGKLADICAQYLEKGKKVYIEGRIQTRSWDGEDGKKRYRTEIVGENMIMLDRGNSGNSNVSTEPVFEQPAQQEVTEQDIKVEDIPF